MDRIMLEITPSQFAGLLKAELDLERDLFLLLNNFNDHSIKTICEAYRQLCAVVELVVPRDFNNAKDHEDRLWNAHHQGQKQFHKALKRFRKNTPPGSVQTRVFTKNYMIWLKQSEKFYRSYIAMLNVAAGGIPELEAIAHTSEADAVRTIITPSQTDKILSSCHRALISLGDLSRYRASERLDNEPNYGPALGYYGLAATLKPSHGVGHHQQAVVALAQNHHLRAIFHLYRSMTVTDAHPLAEDNLRLEMDKTIAAFDKGELIERRGPRDPEAPKLSLVGWFVRLHSTCYDGKVFRGQDELEQEVLAQLSNVLKQRSLDGTLIRMILVNISAQYIAGQRFQANQALQNQQAFLSYFRLNMKTFTVLLNLFCTDLRSLLVGMAHHDRPLVLNLTDIGCRLLPALRVYSNWLRFEETVPMIDGLVKSGIDEGITEAAAHFWPVYIRAVDLVTQAFPVWDMEEQTKEVAYMLDEDVATFQFLPLTDNKTRSTWYDKTTGELKKRSTDHIPRLSSNEELLWRVKDFQAVGLYMALDVPLAPLSISPKNRVYSGDARNIEPLTVPQKVYKPAPPPKPVSYAQAAARPLTVGKNPAQEALAERMVASLVDDDDAHPGTDDNQPITPPQQALVPVVKNGPWVSHAGVNSAGSAGLLFGAGGGLWSPAFAG